MPSSFPRAPLTSPSACLCRTFTRIGGEGSIGLGGCKNYSCAKDVSAPIIKFFLGVRDYIISNISILGMSTPRDKRSRTEQGL